jgi:DNA polymerase III delta prime subunit
MSDPERPPSSFEIKNEASNRGAQGVFNAPVYFSTGSSVAPDRRNRERMLERVHTFWIKGVLEQSLHGAALIALDLHEQSDLIENPWRLVLQEVDQPARSLPPGTRITQAYTEAGGELLILGEPGAGKTTLLLELARDLLDRAKQDDTHPMPVVFNLSSWASKRQPIAEWLVEELNTKYQVPRKMGKEWVETDQLLLLLDGLDEVSPTFRLACVDAINTYRREHGLIPTVVCSRSADYPTQTTRVLLHSAVVVQPLTPQQIYDYLSNAGEQLESVREALHDDPALQELAATPLMLSVLTLAYQGRSSQDLLGADSPETRRRQVFAAYVQRMLQRRSAETHYPLQQTMHWLKWLASQMARHSQTEFYIERMQMNWLPERWFHKVLSSLVFGLIYGLFFGLIFGYSFMLVLSPPHGLLYGLLIGLFNILVFGVLNGLVFGVLAGFRNTGQTTGKRNSLWGRMGWNLLKNRIAYGFICGLLNALLLLWLVGPVASLIDGLLIGVAYGWLGKFDREIRPVEVVTWSWVSVRRNMNRFLGGGLLIGFLYGQVTSLFYGSSHLAHLFFGLIVGVSVGLILGLMSGLSNEMLDKRNRVIPNQGIRNSLQNSLLLGLMYGLVFGLIFGLVYGQVFYWILGPNYVTSYNINNGLVYGPAVGLIVAGAVWISNGGAACTLHALLRFLLWRAKDIPWNYPQFLDYATERILLRKIGGGYSFVHRLLLEYFASLDSTLTPDE